MVVAPIPMSFPMAGKCTGILPRDGIEVPLRPPGWNEDLDEWNKFLPGEKCRDQNVEEAAR